MIRLRSMDLMYVANKAAIVNEKNEILLVGDAGTHHTEVSRGKLDLPGGRMAKGENPRQGLDREVFEETGIDISKHEVEIIGASNWYIGGDENKEQVTGIFWLVRVQGNQEVILSDEHSFFVWHRIDKTPEWETYSFTDYLLKELRKKFEIQEADPSILGRQGYGLIQLYHGHGKGKTTAALGLAMRAAGAGKKVAIVYFDKGGSAHYSERALLDQIDNIDYFVSGRDRIDEKGRFDFSIIEKDKIEARRGLKIAEDLLSGEYDLVVLDEINSTIALGMLDVIEVIEVIKEKKSSVELILTGRDPHSELLNRAHLVTEMKPQKHYFYSGVKAREGLDY
ncbi:hypothetical protein CO057_02640 [Candidatus Uhrbacteria bacterium CG_4_9_14_0_2_um_filter_41_50]|uniref:Nudix hydrolase domain-containing protein n=1 Tax=Candidatus Uhrbacteria bacterium CG_4_9_14_0_2_um_filter_41_50 TaxID=1975031 RepID=A0A2M8EP08_9BACT|nr:MAG: hypothetical protein COZ45_00275 [Candidatus Uhrbacteria bacterium CG_4_10_14_3_um_filter_41_21]PIZ55342.1 MAG: hypothetical protein COY24_00745 [Candidatus Uhrbacteria bacterium CG_4_10_14_0_2_um_filter_41_21]PJB84565.1 MAG: hypothetical protein CO086_02920 [Candidatus Uhrbacteria bacterium CG_4_9_14_0_8_um_filter_41_16]PJC24469.1 MAG: hypothetical protein CO057_02640 [Candidatus Uhrbacteria bacterium CG_4_9_14_0_2_um_filter_41_50]PJE75419.1 MAG: hypothetical protein COV03_00215 [Candi